ncbi:MAG: T9SS type A sorting domain-containing protein [Bacteroidales bacterium]|nr:T9SS type A sorting domain-containing protein [Bacteroidales bacterium]
MHMKVNILILEILLGLNSVIFCQEITQLGIWNNNANFTVSYYQDRLITSTTSGIIFLDVSNPANPVPSASLPNPSSFPMAIEINGNYAYFGGGMVGYFMIADISNLNFPVQTGIENNINGTAYQIAIKDDCAFMPTNQDILYAIDISDKSSPVVIDNINMGGFSSGIAVKGNYAYVGTENGLKVVNIADPSNLTVVNTFGGNYRRISADPDNDRLFIAKSGTGFDVIDISDPMNPVGLFQGIGGSSTGNLVYNDGFVFQIGSASVSAFEIGNNSSTYLASFSSTIAGQVNDVSARDSVFYLSTVNDVHVLKLSFNPTGIDETSLKSQFTVYPNPSSDFIIVKPAHEMIITNIDVFNSSGRLVRKVEDRSELINISLAGWEAGIYYLSLKSNNVNKTVKFVKK